MLLLLPAVGRWKMDCDGYPCVPMPLMCTAFAPGQIDAAVAGISDPIRAPLPRQKRCTFADRPPSLPRRRAPILTPPTPHCAIPHALSADMPVCRSTVSPTPPVPCWHLDTPADEESPAIHATHILFASAASVLLHLPSPYLPKSLSTCGASAEACACSPAT